MGCYINPENETSEQFLAREAILSRLPKSFSEIQSDRALVCVVNNGTFKAAGIIFSQRLLEDFNDPSDNRHKSWYQVEKAKLYGVSNITPEKFEVETV